MQDDGVLSRDFVTSRTTAETEYRAAESFREACFIASRSYLYPDLTIWTPENLQAALTALTSSDDAPAGSKYMERLKLQLADVDESIHILVAESLILYYLFPSSDAIRAETKVDKVKEVLSWRSLLAPERLSETFSSGIGGVGTYYLSTQPHVMSFFLTFALLGKTRHVDFRQAAACEQLADEIRSGSKRGGEARHALLHLFFPELYEPIVSQRHKAQIVSRYTGDGSTSSNQDAILREIRARLSETAGHNISFYHELRSDWDRKENADTSSGGDRDADTIPGYERLMLPLLQLISDGDVHKEKDLIPPLATQFLLSEEDLARRQLSGPPVFANRVTFAKVNLRQAGLLTIPSPGNVQITERGRKQLSEDPDELSRASLKRYPEYVDFLNRYKDDDRSAPRPGNIWIEKTLVAGRPDRQDGEYALGRMLWSPQKAENGRDIYRFMRDVRPGDIVLHLTDNRGFTGVSVVASVAEAFGGVPGTAWADRPSFRVHLKQFRALDPVLPRDAFFASSYRERLIDFRRSGQRNLFYTEGLELVQGGYLTPCPPELAAILNDVYTDIAGEQLTEAPSAELLAEAPEPAYSIADLLRTTLWLEEDLNELLDSLSPEKSCKQIVLAGPPGTSKTWVAQEIIKYLTGGNEARWRLVQFHPSYSYEQFIEGLRPEADGSGITFRAVPGVLLEIAQRSRQSGDSYFLLIDEINRANLPRVLGELLYLFEYRRAMIDLPYTRQFSLPENLFFIATMNTADRSIRSIDAALRRRFEIFECLPNRAILERYYSLNTNQVPDLLDGFDKLNEMLSSKLDLHHTIGHTFFMAPVFSPKALTIVWKRQIKPLIEEYFFDQPDHAKLFTIEQFWPSASQ